MNLKSCILSVDFTKFQKVILLNCNVTITLLLLNKIISYSLQLSQIGGLDLSNFELKTDGVLWLPC